jgi:hypothetical protein
VKAPEANSVASQLPCQQDGRLARSHSAVAHRQCLERELSRISHRIGTLQKAAHARSDMASDPKLICESGTWNVVLVDSSSQSHQFTKIVQQIVVARIVRLSVVCY